MMKKKLIGRFAGVMSLALASVAMAYAQAAADTPAAAPAAASSSPYEGLSTAKQVDLLSRQAASGELAKLTNAQLLEVGKDLQPETLLTWARSEVNKYPEYEYTMKRQERVKDSWQEQPSHMLVRYRHSPRAVYARWLPDGAYAGQEVIYDESRKKDEIYSHLGGVMGFASMWVALDGVLVRAQSNHTVLDLGYQHVLSLLERDAKSLRSAGLSEKYSQARIVQAEGERMLALTWELPADAPKFYAKKVELMFDLKSALPRVVTSWNAQGDMVEKIVFEKVKRKTFDPSVFDPANKEYKFSSSGPAETSGAKTRLAYGAPVSARSPI